MAITARFVADFDQFKANVQSAQTSLKGLTNETDRVAAGMSKAGQAAAASGKSMVSMGLATAGTATSGQSLTTQFRQFDGVLASMGLHMGPQIRALGEIGEASGKTAGQIGKVATAGLVLGAAIGGWQLGRLAAEWLGLDQKIAGAVARLMKWGDLAGETAGAKQDVVTRAIERGAAATISYTDALKFNDKWFQQKTGNEEKAAKATEAAGKVAAKAATEAAAAAEEAARAAERWALVMDELRDTGLGWKGTLDTVNGSIAEAVKFYLAAGVSQGTLATAYGLSATQIKAVASALAAEQAALTAAGEARDIHTARVTTAIMAEASALAQLEVASQKAAGVDVEHTSAAETLRLGLDRLRATAEAGVSQTAQAQVLHNAFSQTLYDEAKAYDVAAASGGSFNGSLERGAAIAKGTAQSFEGLTVSINAATSAAERFSGMNGYLSANEVSNREAGIWQYAPGAQEQFARRKTNQPSFARGGPVMEGSAYLHDNEYVVPEGGALVMRGSGGATVTNHFHIVDTEANIARRVSEHITRSLKSSVPLRA